MWFTEVRPHNPRATSLVVGVQDDDEFNITVANSWLEIRDDHDVSLARSRRLALMGN